MLLRVICKVIMLWLCKTSIYDTLFIIVFPPHCWNQAGSKGITGRSCLLAPCCHQKKPPRSLAFPSSWMSCYTTPAVLLTCSILATCIIMPFTSPFPEVLIPVGSCLIETLLLWHYSVIKNYSWDLWDLTACQNLLWKIQTDHTIPSVLKQCSVSPCN